MLEMFAAIAMSLASSWEMTPNSPCAMASARSTASQLSIAASLENSLSWALSPARWWSNEKVDIEEFPSGGNMSGLESNSSIWRSSRQGVI